MALHVTRLSLGALIVTLGSICSAQAQQAEPSVYPANKVLARALDIETGRRAANPHEARVSSGIMYSVQCSVFGFSRTNSRPGRTPAHTSPFLSRTTS